MKDTQAIVASLSLLEKAALLSGANTWETRAIGRVDIPSIWMADGPHGIRRQTGSADHLGINGSEPATCFPTAATIACSWDEALAESIGNALGAEAKQQQVHVLLGPGLNVKRSPLGGRGFEYYSEDPELSGRLAAGYVRGIQSRGVAATPKHFAANSQELRRMVSDSVVDDRTLHEIYLTAFEIVVKEARPWAIMSAYNLINGEYAHEHRLLLSGVLRDDWGFDGAVISDWGGGNDPVAAVAAGGTLEMPSPGFDSARAIVAAVEAGTLDRALLDARVAEVVELVRRVSPPSQSAPVDPELHHALARRAAAESAVLLKNEDDLLPLGQLSTVALLGDFAVTPRYQGAGSSLVNTLRVPSLVEAVEGSPLVLNGVAQGFHRDGRTDAALLAEAVALAQAAHVAVVCLGLPESDETEGQDRPGLELPRVQVELLRAVAEVNPRTVVLISAGGTVQYDWLDSAHAVVHGHLGGQAGAEAFVDVLCGRVNPSGRLAETAPLSITDTPTADTFPSRSRTAEYREGVFVGYRYYETVGKKVAFPFGYGLSYTSFEYADLVVTPGDISVTITNTGRVAGSEVVQVYVSRSSPSGIPRPRRELKQFTKLTLDPGQSRRIVLPLGERTFRFYDAESRRWEVEAGSYIVSVGRNARDMILHGRVDVEGTIPPRAAEFDLGPYAHGEVQNVDRSTFELLLRRPLQSAGWSGPLQVNDPMDRLRGAKSPVGRWAFALLDGRRRRAEARGRPDLNALFLLNGPFRVLSKMSGGLASHELTESVLVMMNGKTVRGLIRVAAAFVRGRQQEKRSRRAFESLARGADER